MDKGNPRVIVNMAGEGKSTVQDDTKALKLFGNRYGGFSNGESEQILVSI